MKKQRLYIALYLVGFILLIPLIAMQFTDEVNWSLMDFIIAGFLLFGMVLILDLVFRKVKEKKYKLLLLAGFSIIFLLVWAELAVGVFGSPFAGS